MARVLAAAKLTLSLRVTGTRVGGMHELVAEMVTVDLFDELLIDPRGDGLELHDVLKGARAATDDTNLVRRALRIAGRRAHVSITKRIPVGGGLGGGSADAAAVLRWAGCHDPAVAVTLGSDVPFCVVGGRAIVRGVGEQVTPLPFARRSFVLLVPPFGVETAAVYREWDRRRSEGLTSGPPNELSESALVVEPRLARWRDALGDLTGLEPVMAGSGGTWFVDGDRERLDLGSTTEVFADEGAPGRLIEVRTVQPGGAEPGS